MMSLVCSSTQTNLKRRFLIRFYMQAGSERLMVKQSREIVEDNCDLALA